MMGKLKTWQNSNKTKRMPSSVSGLSYEMVTPVKGVVKNSKKATPKDSTVRISNLAVKKTPALNPSTPIQFARDVTFGSIPIPKSIIVGKLKERDKMSSTKSSSQAIPIKRRIGLPKLFIGLKLLRTKRFSVVDLIIILLLAKGLVLVYTHLHINISWH